MKSLIFRAAISQNWVGQRPVLWALLSQRLLKNGRRAPVSAPEKQQGGEEPRWPLATLSSVGPFCMFFTRGYTT